MTSTFYLAFLTFSNDTAEKLYYNFLNSYTLKVFKETIALLIELFPYLIAGILLSTIIKKYISANSLSRMLTGKNTFISICLASVVGIISPLGSYVAIPLSASLIAAGVPLTPMVAFMVATPLINPGLFLLTMGALGVEMAVMRVVSAFIIGIAAGFATLFFETKNGLNNETVKSKSLEDPPNLIRRSFFSEAWRYTVYISKYFFLGIFIAALSKVLIPIEWIRDFLGEEHTLSIFMATLAGVPLYSCGGAAIPIMKELYDMGIDKGAILSFFISGPAVRLSNIILLVNIYRKSIPIIYLVLSISGAIIFGFIYHFI